MPRDGHGPDGALGVVVIHTPRAASSRHAAEATLRAEGLTPRGWSNGADFTYGRHVHELPKVLFCVSGTIVFHTDDGDVALGPGDRMELPPGVQHGATVGNTGVECVEAYRQ